MIADPSVARLIADMERTEFQAGIDAGRWRVIDFAFPRLDLAVSAIQPGGAKSEYGFRADLSNYPAQAPLVRIWDHGNDGPLAVNKRPSMPAHYQFTFQAWASDTVYRPWERMTGLHNNNAVALPHLAWHSSRRITFILEDLHGLLNKHARTELLRAAS